MVFCTIAAQNYLHKAIFLARGLREYHPDAPLIVCVPERELPDWVSNASPFDLVLTVHDLGYARPHEFIFLHSVLELSTAVKARVMTAALALFPQESGVIYIDPDAAAFAPLEAAIVLLDSSDIVVTPHHLAPIRPAQMIPLLRSGAFNLGFLAVRRSTIGVTFLRWLDAVLETHCYVDGAAGIFVDQKWMDLASSFFPITVLRDPGYNVAYWNIAQRPVTVRDGAYCVDGVPLTLFHFSGVDIGRDMRFIRRAAPHGVEPIYALRTNYKDALSTLKAQCVITEAWSYARYDSGEPIAHEARLVARDQPEVLHESDDPFSRSNEYFLSRGRIA